LRSILTVTEELYTMLKTCIVIYILYYIGIYYVCTSIGELKKYYCILFILIGEENVFNNYVYLRVHLIQNIDETCFRSPIDINLIRITY